MLNQHYTEHYQALLKFAVKLTRNIELAEDAVHDAYFRLKSAGVEMENPLSYMFSAVQSAVYNRNRKPENRHTHYSIEQKKTLQDWKTGQDSFEVENVRLVDLNSDTEAQYLKLETYWNLKYQITCLPAKQRLLIEQYLNDVNPSEYARQTNTNLETARANWRHAIIALREKLEVA